MGRGRGIVGMLVGAVLVGCCAVASGAPAEKRNVLLGLERPSASLERFVAQVSDPGSPRYRRHLTVPQMRARFGARPAVVAKARRALAARGVEGRVDPTGTFLVASMDPGDIRATFGRAASLLERGGGDTSTDATALPDDLRGVVTEVVGLDGPPVRPAHNVRHRSIRELRTRAGLELPPRTGRAEGCAAGREIPLPLSPELAPLYAGTRPFTPNQFRTAFGFDGLHARGVQGQGMHIALFELDGGVSRRDVRAFAECFDMPTPRMRTFAVGRDDPIAPIDGTATLEATLDVQAVMTAAPRARIDVIQGDGARVTMPEVLAAALDGRRLGGVPDVVSVSYGFCEPFAEAALGPAQRRLFDHVARIAAGAGVSVLVASGDSGSSACLHNVGAYPLLDETVAGALAIGQTSVGYPASSPAVTAVGGTSMRLTRANRLASQRPWNDTQYGVPGVEVERLDGVPVATFPAGAGTGGASRLYTAPWYQAEAGLRSARRTVPDVSMYADSYPGIAVHCSAWDPAAAAGPCEPNPVTGSPWNAVGGTSFAAPLLAGGIALVNQHARAEGAPPVGFLNPLLYRPATRRQHAFNDVTTGRNAVLPIGCCAARPGYDQATGWGTVDVERLARSAQQAWASREGA